MKLSLTNRGTKDFLIRHPVENYFVLKELVLRLAREKKIELDLDTIA